MACWQAKNKYVNGQALGFDMLDAAGSGRMTWQLGSIVTSPTISAGIMGGGTQFKAPASLNIYHDNLRIRREDRVLGQRGTERRDFRQHQAVDVQQYPAGYLLSDGPGT